MPLLPRWIVIGGGVDPARVGFNVPSTYRSTQALLLRSIVLLYGDWSDSIGTSSRQSDASEEVIRWRGELVALTCGGDPVQLEAVTGQASEQPRRTLPLAV